MIVLTHSPHKLRGHSIIRAIATDWTEFTSMVSGTAEYRDVSRVIIREKPTFKKGGQDYLAININEPRGQELIEVLEKEPYNGLAVLPRTFELASYHLKMSRLKRDKEWTPQVRDYMRAGERSRMVALLRQGEWISSPDVPKKGTVAALLDWQEIMRAIPLGRNNHLRYITGPQRTKYVSKELKPYIRMDLTQDQLLAHCTSVDNFKPYLQLYPESIWDVINIKIQQGKIEGRLANKVSKGPIEDLY